METLKKKKGNKVTTAERAEEEEAIDTITQKEEITINIKMGENTKIKDKELKQLKLNIKKLLLNRKMKCQLLKIKKCHKMFLKLKPK